MNRPHSLLLALPLLLSSVAASADEPAAATAAPPAAMTTTTTSTTTTTTTAPPPADQATSAAPAAVAMPPLATAPVEPLAPPPPPIYSIPWALRGIIPVSVLRLDTAIGFFDRPDTKLTGLNTTGQTAVIMPSAGYKFTPNLMGIWRWGLVANSPPELTKLNNAISISNMAIGLLYGIKLPASFRLGLFLALTIPIGSGGYGSATTYNADGSVKQVGSGDPNTTEATRSAILDREGMDNVMFAVNDVSAVFGLDAAYVGHRLTVQIEVTLLQLMRVRNEFFQADQFRTNSTAGLHVGYAVTKWLSLAGELRYQRFLSDPAAVLAGTQSRDNLSLALGPRFLFKTATGTLRPSIAYSPGLAGDLRTQNYHVIIVDLPVIF